MKKHQWNYKKTLELHKKRCYKCETIKPLDDFYKAKLTFNKRDGYRNQCKECSKKNSQTPQRKYYFYKRRAGLRGRDLSLSFEDFCTFLIEPCFYCGLNTKKIELDRVDNKLGYIKGNVVSCCRRCNSLKKFYSLEQLEQMGHIARKIREFFKKT